MNTIFFFLFSIDRKNDKHAKRELNCESCLSLKNANTIGKSIWPKTALILSIFYQFSDLKWQKKQKLNVTKYNQDL